MNQPHLALTDANRAVQLDPTWAKAYRRKGSVLEALEDFDAARGVYEKSLEVALEGIEDGDEVERRKAAEEVQVLLEGRYTTGSCAGGGDGRLG